MSDSSMLSVLELPEAALVKLAALRITTVAAFASRVSDPASAESLREHIDVDPETMAIAVERALEVAPPVVRNRALGGALVR